MKKLYNEQKGNNQNILIIFCGNCGEMYEEEIEDYNSFRNASRCPYCNNYNSL